MRRRFYKPYRHLLFTLQNTSQLSAIGLKHIIAQRSINRTQENHADP